MSVKQVTFEDNNEDILVHADYLNSIKDEVNNTIEKFETLDQNDFKQLLKSILYSSLGKLECYLDGNSTSNNFIINTLVSYGNGIITNEFNGLRIICNDFNITNNDNATLNFNSLGSKNIYDKEGNQITKNKIQPGTVFFHFSTNVNGWIYDGRIKSNYPEVSEYESNKIYKLNQLCSYEGELYKSLINNNDKSPTDTTGWIEYSSSTSSTIIPVGSILPFAGQSAPTQFLLCVGQEISKETYSTLYNVIGNRYGNPQSANNFVLPNLKERFIEGNNSINQTTVYKSAGLPNLEGSMGNIWREPENSTGVFKKSRRESGNRAMGSDANVTRLFFDASDGNPIYGNSNTVQPKSICLNYIIKYI